MRVVAALGGNALSPGGGTGTVEEMRAVLAATAVHLADVVERGASLVLTHGNGPQVGRLLLQQEYGAREGVPPMPMDVCGALSQGQIGYLVQQALDSELRRRIHAVVLCLVTQVVVDGRDPAFRRPTKPVGPAYDRVEAQRIAAETGHVFAAMPDGRWQRVVASPLPLRFVEQGPLRQVVEAGHVVVAAGGGGVPVVEVGAELRGVEAVVDKDRTAARLARLVGAALLLVLTDVERVQTGFGTPRARPLARLSVAQAEELLGTGELPEGSMGPKVAACVDFVRSGGERAVITALERASDAVFGDAGTQVFQS